MTLDGNPLPTSKAHESLFRGDIQGLRGIAVLLILLFHASIPGFRGGFVGVDIFFVLSGYLITGNLLREVQNAGRIHFKKFYARRIRRLLPASFFVLISTLVVVAIWFPPLLLPGVALDISSAGLYISNIDFALRATDYFSATVIPSPVLHFWSLGVEEQFYLFWPLLIALATVRKRAPVVKVFLLALAVFVSSLTFANWLLPRNQPWAFFSLPTRAWELILGALLATAIRFTSKLPRAVSAVCGLIGLALVIFSGLTQANPLKFPGTAALTPTVGAFLLILAGSTAELTIPSRLLTFQPLQWLGRISYSLYLWHWPVLVIPQVVIGSRLSLEKRALLALLSILLAALTERWVERPFRGGWLITLKPGRNILMAGALAAILVVTAFSADYAATGSLRNKHAVASAAEERSFIDSLVIKSAPLHSAPIRKASIDFPVPASLKPNLLNADHDRPISYGDRCHTQMNLRASTAPCIYGDTASSKTVVLFGDSHALAWFPAMNQVAKEMHWKLLSLTMSACSPADIPAYNSGTGLLMRNCPIWRSASIDRIVAAKPYMVLVASTRGFQTLIKGLVAQEAAREHLFAMGMKRTIAQLRVSGAKMLMMSDTPVLAQNPLVCLSAHPKSTLACATPVATAISNNWIALETLVAKVNLVPLIKPQLWVCPTSPCPVVIGNILTYFDIGHMTATFSQALAGRLKKAINVALAPKVSLIQK
jgi:peptidoglycan/LPS O-acetylase OafA/YrhL